MSKRQHKTPCAECPFRRRSLPGWLGGLLVDDFRALAQSETIMPCHTRSGRDGVDYGARDYNLQLPQCAGRAIFWSNQLKEPRNPKLLRLPRDTETVFQWPHEFVAHHSGEKKP